MNPWLRVLGLLGAAVAAALLLRVLPAPLVLAVLLGGTAFASHALRERPRRPTDTGAAELLGLQAVDQDPFGVVAYPLSLFDRGSGGHPSDMVFGRWGGLDVTVFDYGYRPSVVPEGAPADRTFTCALAAAPLECAHLVAEPEAFLTAAEDRSVLGEVRVGDGSFDRAFDVRCDDPAFAASFLDGELTSWLLEQQARWGLEVNARIAMVYAPRVAAEDRPELLRALRDVLDRIPVSAFGPRPGEPAAGAG